MSAAFIQFMRCEATDELLRHPNCFALLALVAQRARRDVPLINPYGLQIGEAMVGDPAAVGLSRQEFRTALSNLQKWGLITTRATNKGTIAKLSNSAIYDINAEADNQQPNPKKTRRQPLANQSLTTNNNVIIEEEIIEETSSLRSEVGAAEKKIEVVEASLPEVESPAPELRTPGGAADVGTSVAPIGPTPPKAAHGGRGKRRQVDEPEPEHFAAFYAAYPRKENRAAALTAFRSLCPEWQAAAMARVADWFACRPDLQSPRGDFRPHPSTWLNQTRFLDQDPKPAPIIPVQYGTASTQQPTARYNTTARGGFGGFAGPAPGGCAAQPVGGIPASSPTGSPVNPPGSITGKVG